MIKELSSNYKDVLKKEKKPYVLEFYTQWCGVCQQVMPFFKEVAEQYGDQYAFYKIDAEKNMEIAKEYDVTSVPTLIFIKNGEIKDTHHGYISKDDIVAKLTKSFS